MFSAVREQIARFFLFIANFFGYRSHIQQQLDEDAYVFDMTPEEFAEYDRALTIAEYRGGTKEIIQVMREYSSRYHNR
jgi:hypothetical protein